MSKNKMYITKKNMYISDLKTFVNIVHMYIYMCQHMLAINFFFKTCHDKNMCLKTTKI